MRLLEYIDLYALNFEEVEGAYWIILVWVCPCSAVQCSVSVSQSVMRE